MRLERLLATRPGLSAAQVARMIGRAQSTVYTWFEGKSEPRLSEAAQLADVFGVSLDELAGRRTLDVPTAAEKELLALIREFGVDPIEARKAIWAMRPPGNQVSEDPNRPALIRARERVHGKPPNGGTRGESA